MDSYFVASALFLILTRPLTWHGLSSFVCSLQGLFWFPFLKCEVCRVKRVYFGNWAYLIKDKRLPCVSKLMWLVKCNVNSIFWNIVPVCIPRLLRLLRFYVFCSFFFFFSRVFPPSQAATVHVPYMNSSSNTWPVFYEQCIRHCLRTHKFYFLSFF